MALSSFLNVNGYDFPPPRRGFSWTITTTEQRSYWSKSWKGFVQT